MRRVFLLIAILATAAIACNLNVNVPSAPKPPIPSLVPSENEANAFEQSFQTAANQVSQTGNFTVTINQTQFSSWLALRAPGYASQQGYEWPLKEVQAALDNGKITLYGVITKPNVPDTPAQVIFTPSIDGSGELQVKVESGQVGVVGVPSEVLNSLNKTIEEILRGQLAQIRGHYKLTTLNIGGGNMTVSGQIVQ